MHQIIAAEYKFNVLYIIKSQTFFHKIIRSCLSCGRLKSWHQTQVCVKLKIKLVGRIRQQISAGTSWVWSKVHGVRSIVFWFDIINQSCLQKQVCVFKGWKLEKVPFSFYPWCIQSELSLVKHGQKSKVRTVLKLSGSPLFKTVLTFDY